MPQLVSIATSPWRRRPTHPHSRNFIHHTTISHRRARAQQAMTGNVVQCVRVRPSWKFARLKPKRKQNKKKHNNSSVNTRKKRNPKKQRLFIIVEENYWKSYTLKIKHKKPVEKLCFICFHPDDMHSRALTTPTLHHHTHSIHLCQHHPETHHITANDDTRRGRKKK